MLYDALRRCIQNYDAQFAETPFAARMGPKGTTARLSAWPIKLASIFNTELEARIRTLVLRFFQSDMAVPVQESDMAVPVQESDMAVQESDMAVQESDMAMPVQESDVPVPAP